MGNCNSHHSYKRTGVSSCRMAISSIPSLIFWIMMGRELKMEMRPDEQ